MSQTIGLSREDEGEVIWAGEARQVFPEDAGLKAGIEPGQVKRSECM